MDEFKRSLVQRGETLNYRMAARQFERAFEWCERLPQAEQESLLKEIAEHLLKKLRTAAGSEEQVQIAIPQGQAAVAIDSEERAKNCGSDQTDKEQ